MAEPEMSDVQRKVAQIVKDEIQTHEDETVFVTEQVAFNMRPLIRQLRRNYWGVFESAKDKVTGREKIHTKLTQEIVEQIVKHVDIDVKDVHFRSKRGRDGIATTEMVRAKSQEWMQDNFFGELMDQTERAMCIDGTAVWKFGKKKVNGRWEPTVRQVDLLNVFIDPTAKSIQDAYRFTERAVMTIDEVKSMDWMNTDAVEADEGINPNDPSTTQAASTSNSTSKYVEVFETWGKFPATIFDENADKRDVVDAHVIVSNPRKNPVVHLLEKNTNKDKNGNALKPYEEVRYSTVTGRWYGLGPAEKVMVLEKWRNMVVNIRINRNVISQLGLFSLRTGSGINQEALSKMMERGIIQVKDHDDLRAVAMQDGSASSYQDEETINRMTQALTSAFDVISGESLPASATATSSAIQDRNAKSAFTLVKEQMGFFIQRSFDRHLLPVIGKNMKKGDIIRIAGDTENIDQLRQRVVRSLAYQELKRRSEESGFVPSFEEVQMAVAKAEDKLRKDGELYFELTKDIVADGIDTHVFMTNEDLDSAVTVQNLIAFAQLDPQNVNHYISIASDILGIDRPTPSQQQPQNISQGAANQVQSPITDTNVPTEQQQITGANTLGA